MDARMASLYSSRSETQILKASPMSDARTNILGCRYEQGVFHKLYFRQSQNILKKLIHSGSNVYLKPNDIISHRPTLFGYHEPHLEALFKDVSRTHSDFLLDIGANIGLTSVMGGGDFTDIHCVEPNGTLAKILDVNLELNGLSDRSTIHTVGLGDEDKVEGLWIPRVNFGGAFVQQGNAYDGSNDTAPRSSDDDYIIQNIQLVDAKAWLADLFAANQHWRNGLIKIDVEGFELKIFEALLETLPKTVSTVIVMENFLHSIDFQQFRAQRHDLEWFGFYKTRNWIKSIPFKLLGMSSYYAQNVRRIDPDDKAPHDIIVLATPET